MALPASGGGPLYSAHELADWAAETLGEPEAGRPDMRWTVGGGDDGLPNTPPAGTHRRGPE